MFGFGPSTKFHDAATLAALNRSVAIIEFDPTGKILAANEIFCALMGYSASELVGRDHGLFVDPALAGSAAHREFWAKLGRGDFESGEYARLAKGGRTVWLGATYVPTRDAREKVVRVLQVGIDITAEKLRSGESESKMKAVSLAQAVIEFTPEGEILTANENFLKTMGYRLDEIKGRHHRMFVDPAHAASADYREFWRKLNAGEFIAGSFRRIGKGGKEVWLQASYSPIFDLGGKLTKIVKFASDISELTLLGAGLERLAANDVADTIDVSFSPTFDGLRQDFNGAIGNLRSALRGVAESAKMVASGATEIANVSDDLSKRTEQQAASLEQTAAALDEVTATVRKTAEGAKHANEVVAMARGDAQVSGEVVKRAVSAMGLIQKSSQQIEQIISVIDEIAFQTNLLALNAGVEAARAGEAGRGFAVVASEVRALAQRSADAAKEIKVLITSSKNEVDNGVKLVAETGESLERIVGRVGEINSVVTDIAAGATEQATALGEVNTAVNQLDQTTQQNAAMAEQATAAGQSMSVEADKLTAAIGQFRLGAESGGDRMRAELKKAVPHAFAAPGRPAARPAHAAAAEARPAKKVATAGRASPRATESWNEF